VLFIYEASSKSTTYQNTISYGLFAIIGGALLTVAAWIIYRLVRYIR
jgi:uncharacterized membrane protein